MDWQFNLDLCTLFRIKGLLARTSVQDQSAISVLRLPVVFCLRAVYKKKLRGCQSYGSTSLHQRVREIESEQGDTNARVIVFARTAQFWALDHMYEYGRSTLKKRGPFVKSGYYKRREESKYWISVYLFCHVSVSRQFTEKTLRGAWARGLLSYRSTSFIARNRKGWWNIDAKVAMVARTAQFFSLQSIYICI